jgi:hypothetical protein
MECEAVRWMQPAVYHIQWLLLLLECVVHFRVFPALSEILVILCNWPGHCHKASLQMFRLECELSGLICSNTVVVLPDCTCRWFETHHCKIWCNGGQLFTDCRAPAPETTRFSKHKLRCKQSTGERESNYAIISSYFIILRHRRGKFGPCLCVKPDRKFKPRIINLACYG